MCGIVGILGDHEVGPILVNALKKLEYRGYDSAGIATLNDGKLGRRRSLGKLAELNLARAIGTSDDYFLFITRPWSLFFILMALVSVLFPFYQNASKDTLFSKLFVPISMIVLSFPLFLMQSPVRMIIAAILLLAGSYFVYKRMSTLQAT